MSLELIYTSAAKGLRPSSSGFCTVAATGGMSKAVATKLEGLSAYDFYYKLSDPNAADNPANFSHTSMRLGASTHSVLSRVGFCGPDFSGRANKIAHHVVLSDEDRLRIGPAEMMLQMRGRVFCEQYADPPRDLPPRPLSQQLSHGPMASDMAQTWHEFSGDAGWAGTLAKAFVDDGRTPAYVVCEPGMDVLRLMAESLSLLPPAQRWQVNFATYYTSLPAGCFYHWRAVLAGTRAAAELRRFPRAAVIDLTRPLPAAPEDAYSAAAREGTQVAIPAPASQDRQATTATRVARAAPSGQRAPKRTPDATGLAIAELADGADQLPPVTVINASPVARKLAIVFGILAMVLLITNAITLVLWQNEAGTSGGIASVFDDDQPAAGETEAKGDTATDGVTETEGDTATDGVTETEGDTGTDGVTETEGDTATDGVTETDGDPTVLPISHAAVADWKKAWPECEEQPGDKPTDFKFSYDVPRAVTFVQSPPDVEDVMLEIVDDSGDATSAELLAKKTPDDGWDHVATCTLEGGTLTVLYKVDPLEDYGMNTIVVEVATRAEDGEPVVYQCRELPLRTFDLAWGYDDNGGVIMQPSNPTSTGLEVYVRPPLPPVLGKRPPRALWRQLELAGDDQQDGELTKWLGEDGSSPFPLVDSDDLDVSLSFTPETEPSKVVIAVTHGLQSLKDDAKVPAFLAAVADIECRADAASQDYQKWETRCEKSDATDKDRKAKKAAATRLTKLEDLLEDLKKKESTILRSEGDQDYEAARSDLIERIMAIKHAIDAANPVVIEDPWGMPVLRVNLEFQMPTDTVNAELIRIIGLDKKLRDRIKGVQ